MAFLSVDGGATKTVAIIYDYSGDIISTGLASSSNYRNVGVIVAKKNIERAINESLKRGGKSIEDIEFSTFALAGVKDSDQSTKIISDFVSSIELNSNFELLNDGEAGFKCRFPIGDGIVVAPGTGMIAYGKKEEKMDRCSGWGWFIGDEGGAFYIGRRAIQEAAKEADGRSKNKSILPMIMKKFKVEEPRKIVNHIYNEHVDIREIASIAALVSNAANKGDTTSKIILKEAAKEAALCATALIKNMKFNEITVSGYGGVYRSGELYWSTLRDEVLKTYPNINFKEPLMGYHAVLGSLQIVLDKHGKQMDDKQIDVLSKKLTSKIMEMPSEELREFLLI